MQLTKKQTIGLMSAMLAVASAHRARVQPFGPELAHQEYHAPSLSPSFWSSPSSFYSAASSNADPKVVALEFVERELTTSDYVVKNAYTSKHNGVTHVYLRQMVDGLEVVNGDININVDKHGRILSYGDSFYKGRPPKRMDEEDEKSVRGWLEREVEFFKDQASQLTFGGWRRRRGTLKQRPVVFKPSVPEQETLAPQDALLSLARHLNIEIPRPDDLDIVSINSLKSDKVEVIMTNVAMAVDGKVPVSQAYIQNEDGQLELVYDFKVEMKDTDNWFHAHVNAHTGKVVQLIDWVSDATYNVFPMGVNDPADGERKLLKDPHNTVASPLGWHDQGKNKQYKSTIGNNVYAGENRRNGHDWKNNPRPEGVDKNGELTFDFELDLAKDPDSYIDAAVTNLFYWNNQVHDVFYDYGFDEVSGNFQQNNFDRGGEDGDAVIANAQDGSGYNNANFATPPDGQHGKMRMYVWDITDPMRDGDLEAGIIIHEYAHGISTRLTGGPANSGCLGWGEAGGMGEGWGDFFATMFRQNETHTYESEFPMGAYSAGGSGIRRYPYSTNMKTNPETFKVMDQPAYWGVHAKGEVWAQMLFEVYQNLHKKLPFTSDWYAKDKTKYANTLAIQLVVDGLKLQPCTPSFIQARNAILQAEQVLTGGKYQCDIWRGFTKRGLGPKAKVIGANSPFGSIRTESFELPSECDGDDDSE